MVKKLNKTQNKRAREEGTERASITLPASEMAALRRLSKARMMSVSAVVSEFVRRGLSAEEGMESLRATVTDALNGISLEATKDNSNAANDIKIAAIIKLIEEAIETSRDAKFEITEARRVDISSVNSRLLKVDDYLKNDLVEKLSAEFRSNFAVIANKLTDVMSEREKAGKGVSNNSLPAQRDIEKLNASIHASHIALAKKMDGMVQMIQAIDRVLAVDDDGANNPAKMSM